VSLENYRTVFLISSLVLILIAASPTLMLAITFPSGKEAFSELWILGPNHLAEDYPFNVYFNESYDVFVGVGNHMGDSSYYLIYVKFCNQTQSLLNSTSSEPSPLAPLYEFRAFVGDGGVWEAGVTFSVSDALFHNGSLSVNRMIINGEAVTLSSFSKWDLEHSGFYYQLFFELWLYDRASRGFVFNNRVVGIWLNVTT
jgi:hypothetical protein